MTERYKLIMHSQLKYFLALVIIPILLAILPAIYEIWGFKFRLLSTLVPRNSLTYVLLIHRLLILISIFVGVPFLLVSAMNCVLLMFRESLLTFKNLAISVNSLFTVAWRISGSTEINVICKKDKLWYSRTLDKSLMYIINNNGPKMDHWGTPLLVPLEVEETLWYVTNCFLLTS